jgi:hypothetical protein
MRNVAFLMLLFSVISINVVHAQLSINGEIRPRMEFRDGYRRQPDSISKPAYIASQRSRLVFDYKGNKFTTRFSFQDSRIWGESALKDSKAKLGVNELWGEMELNPNLSVRLGRQQIKYDDQKILDNGNWGITGLSHDMALIKLKLNTFQAHWGSAYNNNSDTIWNGVYTISGTPYKGLSYLWLNNQFTGGYNLSILGMVEGLQRKNSPNTLYSRYTYGTYFEYLNDSVPFGVKASVYIQNGKLATGQNVHGYTLLLKASYKLSQSLIVKAGGDYYSGHDSLNSNNKTTVFERPYGLAHSINGYMEYFTDIPKETRNGGLIDLSASITKSFNKVHSLDLMYHCFSLSGKVKDPRITGKALNSYLGSEIDLTYQYQLSKEVSFQAGYSTMLYSKSMNIVKGMKNISNNYYADWCYLMITFKPTFFQGK